MKKPRLPPSRHNVPPRKTPWKVVLPLVLGGGSACGGAHDVPEHPTWADVEPIMRGACTQCHGATAAVNGSSDALTVRLDFYEVTAATCGEAAQVLAGQTLGRGWAPLIKAAVTPPGSGWRPRMPPAPAPELYDWQRDTIIRWASEPEPLRGEPSRQNHRPDIQLEATSAQPSGPPAPTPSAPCFAMGGTAFRTTWAPSWSNTPSRPPRPPNRSKAPLRNCAPIWPPMHPRWLRCSSSTYVEYDSSSRLASGAPRRPRWARNF
jgi:hypothetical protein